MKKKIWEYRQIAERMKPGVFRNVVLVGGCFDLLHYGHHTFLKNAKAQGDSLIIALESDISIKVRKQKTPIHTQMERAEVLSSLEYVDAVILLPYFNSDAEYQQLVEQVHPSVIAVTEGDKDRDKKQRQADGIGAKVIAVTRLMPRFATQKIINNFE